MKYQLFKMGLVEDNVCRLCQEEEETAEHLICECVAVARRRRHILEREVLTPDVVMKADPKDLIRFFKGLNLEGY